MKIVEKVWGREEWIVNNELYCGKKLFVRSGWRCSLHYHKVKHETFYIQQGRIWMEYCGKAWIMLAGDTLTIEPGRKHRFTGLRFHEGVQIESVIFEFSTPHDDEDVYRLEESCRAI
jgi:mannose-6-phosphate isomerase-like protein (cupin superfamily)